MPDEKEENHPDILQGPDPHEWPDGVIGQRAADVKEVLRVQKLLRGGGIWNGPVHNEATSLVESILGQARNLLALAVLETYGVQVPDPEEEKGPFSEAGRPRAFGTGAQEPPATA